MRGWPLWLSIATFATVLARGFLDFGYVFREFTDMSASAIAAPMVGYVVFYTLWLWAFLTAARGSRGGAIAILAFDAFAAIAWGLGTIFFLCPTPCATAAPIADAVIYGNVLFGAAAAVAVFRTLR